MSLGEGTYGTQGLQRRGSATDTPVLNPQFPRERSVASWDERSPSHCPREEAPFPTPCFPPCALFCPHWGPLHRCPPQLSVSPVPLSACPLPGLCPHRVREVHSVPPGCRQACDDPPVGHSRWDRRGQGGQLCPPLSHPGVSGCPTCVVMPWRGVPVP